MRRPPQRGNTGGHADIRVGTGGTYQAHGRGAGILLMVGVQDEKKVQRACGDRMQLERLARHFLHHVQEARGVFEVVAGVADREANRVAITRRGNRRHLGNQAHRRQPALLRVLQVQRVVIETGQRAEHAGQHRHRVRVVAEALQELLEGLVQHRVVGDFVLEPGEPGLVRKLTVHQQVGNLEEAGLLGQLLDRVAAVQQYAGVAIDVGDRRLAAGSGTVARVIGEAPGFLRQLGDVDAGLAEDRLQHRQGDRRVAGGKGHLRELRHDALLVCERQRPGDAATGGRAEPRWGSRLSHSETDAMPG